MWDTDYAARTPSDFSCDVLRGSRAHRLFLLNHFLTAPLASLSLGVDGAAHSTRSVRVCWFRNFCGSRRHEHRRSGWRHSLGVSFALRGVES